MRHKDERGKHLDSGEVRYFTRHRVRRGLLPALVSCLLFGLAVSGCGEDRSNLIPKDTSESLISNLDRIQSLAASGECFEAAKVALETQQEIETLGPEVDSELKRSLLDGVTELTLLVNDPEKCTESNANVIEEPTVTEEPDPDTAGTTGDTGTTDVEPTTTGDQGTTDENQNPEQPQGNGTDNPAPTPAPEPEQPTTPTPPTIPTTPPATGPGSGGLGPG